MKLIIFIVTLFCVIQLNSQKLNILIPMYEINGRSKSIDNDKVEFKIILKDSLNTIIRANENNQIILEDSLCAKLKEGFWIEFRYKKKK